jgi:hypothetical protein
MGKVVRLVDPAVYGTELDPESTAGKAAAASGDIPERKSVSFSFLSTQDSAPKGFLYRTLV